MKKKSEYQRLHECLVFAKRHFRTMCQQGETSYAKEIHVAIRKFEEEIATLILLGEDHAIPRPSNLENAGKRESLTKKLT